MTEPNRLMDEMARFVTDAMSVAQGVQREAQTLAKSQLERLLRDMDLVTRDEFEVVKAMAATLREQNERLNARVAVLERRLSSKIPDNEISDDNLTEEQMGDMSEAQTSRQQQG